MTAPLHRALAALLGLADASPLPLDYAVRWLRWPLERVLRERGVTL